MRRGTLASENSGAGTRSRDGGASLTRTHDLACAPVCFLAHAAVSALRSCDWRTGLVRYASTSAHLTSLIWFRWATDVSSTNTVSSRAGSARSWRATSAPLIFCMSRSSKYDVIWIARLYSALCTASNACVPDAQLPFRMPQRVTCSRNTRRLISLSSTIITRRFISGLMHEKLID